MDFDKLAAVFGALERERVRYVVFGAIALNLQGLARFTDDLDLFVAPDAENIDRLKKALFSVFRDVEIDQITAEDLLGDYPAVQYVAPDETFQIDILTRLGTAFAFDDLEAERIQMGTLSVSVATPKTLYRMKRDTVRLKDRADAEMLRQRFNLEEK